MKYSILVVDDEHDIRDLLKDILKDGGYDTKLAANSEQAFEQLNECMPTAILLDVWLERSDVDGLGILEIVRKKYPQIPVIMISGHATIDIAVKSIRMGAFDYLEKPLSMDRVLLAIKRACEVAKLQRENAELKIKAESKTKDLIGTSQAISQLRGMIEKVAPTSGRILIHGAIGTGKDVVANIIHKKSKRALRPFIAYNPRGKSGQQIQYELFGNWNSQEPVENRPRRVSVLERTRMGTLYITEVAALPLSVQGILLNYIQQEQNNERNHKSANYRPGVRLITATSKNLEHEVSAGRFRQDLYNRLNVVQLRIPTLGERREDIPQLVNQFLDDFARKSGYEKHNISDSVMTILQNYDWPGNVRQLYNVIEWLVIMSESQGHKPIDLTMLPPELSSRNMSIIGQGLMGSDVMSLPIRDAREIFERQYLLAQVNRFNGNISKTSAFVGMERSALHRKLKSLNINTANSNVPGNFVDKEDELEEAMAE
jgi:two-component system nitrogen regulation response regulator NtrX